MKNAGLDAIWPAGKACRRVKPSAVPKMLAMIPSVFRGVDLSDLERIKDITRATFPSVPQMSTTELAAKVERNPASVLVVDVRSAKEFEVSHLPGAILAGSAESIAKTAKERGVQEVVLYCSVGFRSSRLASVLRQKGLSGVSNLEGSIFVWANEGRPLLRGTDRVHTVHPYGNRWAGLLKAGLALRL